MVASGDELLAVDFFAFNNPARALVKAFLVLEDARDMMQNLRPGRAGDAYLTVPSPWTTLCRRRQRVHS